MLSFFCRSSRQFSQGLPFRRPRRAAFFRALEKPQRQDFGISHVRVGARFCTRAASAPGRFPARESFDPISPPDIAAHSTVTAVVGFYEASFAKDNAEIAVGRISGRTTNNDDAVSPRRRTTPVFQGIEEETTDKVKTRRFDSPGWAGLMELFYVCCNTAGTG